jgi:hypothetical protein
MTKVRTETVTVKVSTDGRATVTVKVTKEKPKPRRLKFGHGNAKLDVGIYTFSLPAGWFCPFAQDCKSRANRVTGRITDGPHTLFRCFAASGEARGKSVRQARWHNAELLKGKSKDEMVALILDSLTPFAGYVRLHVSGDFFSQDYFDAWVEIARQRPGTRFYGYTKSLPFWVKRKHELPTNFILTASMGGTHDRLIEEHGLRYARVVFSEQEAADLGLEIDHDDSHAMSDGPSFTLLIHGTQPLGSEAAKAVSALRQAGEFGYGERADDIRRERGRLRLALVG